MGLISGYKKPFKKKDGTYKEHVRIEDIYALYYFDDQLKDLFLKYILLIEKHIKSLISYSFCEEYGDEQQNYLNATKYNYSDKNQDDVNDLISKLTKLISNPKNYSYIQHQKKKHGNVPLWVMMKALTLGTIDTTDVHKNMNLPQSKGQYTKGKKDLFAVVIVFKYLLDNEDFIKFIETLKMEIDSLFHSTRCLEELQLLKYMGFPQNWYDIKKL